MKKKILTIVLFVAVAVGSFVLGTTKAETITVEKEVIKTVEVVPSGYIDTTTEEFYNNYVDMRQVTDYTATDEGLQLYLSDGNGYYLER